MRRRQRAPRLTGQVGVPGDKSLSHRALLFAALAGGRSEIDGANLGHDVAATAACLAELGVDIDGSEGRYSVTGRARDGLVEPQGPLWCGNSGTTMRLLLGFCAPAPSYVVFTGDRTLNRRPMLRVVAPLREMGARIDGRNHGDLAPIALRGGPLEPITKELPVASAQVKTAIVLAGLAASGTTSVIEPGPSRDHTERMLAAAGVPVRRSGYEIAIDGPSRPEPFRFEVPGDISSAMFLIGAAALVPGSDLRVTGVGLNPNRVGALEALRSMGADIDWHIVEERMGEPVGEVQIRHRGLHGTEIGGDLVPRLIDEIPLLAAVATQAEGTTVFRDAAELRVKESDRVSTMVDALRLVGANVEGTPDGLVVHGPNELTGGAIDSCGDHRVAMALAVAGLVSRDKVSVAGWSSVETSFPEFLSTLGEAQAR